MSFIKFRLCLALTGGKKKKSEVEWNGGKMYSEEDEKFIETVPIHCVIPEEKSWRSIIF